MTNVLTRRGGALLERCRRWFSRYFAGAEPALCQMALAISALVAGVTLASTYWPQPWGYACLSAALLALLELGLWLARKLLKRLLDHGLGWLMALGLLLAAVSNTVKRGAGEGWTWRVWVFSALVTAALWLLAGSWWSLLRRRVVAPVTVCAGVLSLGMTPCWRRSSSPTALTTTSSAATWTSPQTGRPGRRLWSHPGRRALRGPDRGLRPRGGPGGRNRQPDPVYEPGHRQPHRQLRGRLLGLRPEPRPAPGRVWYPAEGESCPVLFIAHGNHEITTESYLGYAYLGEYLASHGYVVVSVDQNACNMLTGENDGRAVLLLEHIGLLLEYNEEPDSPLYGRLDSDSIAIAGHSRGGEMVATAYLFNGLDQYPENGSVDFDYHYNIKSLIAIAPTVDQYKPADHSVELEDVNYLLLHGAADRDVSNFQGMAQYENISFTGQGDYLKSALYIAGANHGQFNSLWGAYDQSGPFSRLLNTEGLLSEADQQFIAQIFIKVFLDVTLRGDESCRDLLTDWDSCAGQLPDTVYVQCWESSRFSLLADFEEDADLSTASVEGVTLEAVGTSLWTEELMGFAGSNREDTHALRLRWRGGASYRLTMGEALDMTGASLAFDICDLDSDAVEEGDLSLVDGEVVLTDADGNTASARISDFATVYPILPVRTDKLDFLFDTCVYKKAMATVAIPAAAFAAEGEAFDLEAVAEIAFRFEEGGEIALDNIGLEPAREGMEENA